MMAFLLALVVGGMGEAEQKRLRFRPTTTFDTSEYRQNTYGPPDFYCDPTRSLASAGDGSLGDAWNLNQCQYEPDCGDVVGILNVGAGTPVDLAAPNDDEEPAFDPDGVADCTSGAPLVYTARYAAVTMDSSTIASNTLRSEIRQAGTPDACDVTGTGGPTYGSNGHNYITYDGLFVDMAEAAMTGDSGVIGVRGATGVRFVNFKIKGTVTDVDSNPVIYRPDNTLSTYLGNFEVWDFDNDPTCAGLNQEGLFSDQYGDRGYTIEHFLLDNVDNGIFPKGTASGGTVFNYGTIQYGIITQVQSCVRFNDFSATELTTLQYVLCSDWSQMGIVISSETSPPRNLLMQFVTVANGPCNDINAPGGMYIKDDSSAVNVTITNNLIDYLNGGFCRAVNAEEATFAYPTSNYNAYYHAGATVEWSYDGDGSITTIGDWRTATGQEANSQVLGSDPFVNRAAGNYTITGGSAALTASSTGGQIGAYASGVTLGPVF